MASKDGKNPCHAAVSDLTIEWKIPDFFPLANFERFIDGPQFEYLSAKRRIQLRKRGDYWEINIWKNTVDNTSDVPFAYYTIAIKTVDGTVYKSVSGKLYYEKCDEPFYTHEFLAPSDLVRDKMKIAPQDALMVFCTISLRDHSDRFITNAAKQNENSNEKVLENSDHPLMLLSRNFKDLLLSKRGSDVILQVKDLEFPAHKTVLEARSSVFAKMFEHDMLENQTRSVKITDFDPEIIQHVLQYIYSAEIEGFSPGNICQLYKAADKYDLEKLKQKCAEYIETNVTVENICDVLLLADIYKEDKIKDIAQDFIAQHKHDVLSSDSWKLFVEENKSMAYQTLESIMFNYTLKSKK